MSSTTIAAPRRRAGTGLRLAPYLFVLPFVIGYLIALIALVRTGPFFDRRTPLRA